VEIEYASSPVEPTPSAATEATLGVSTTAGVFRDCSIWAVYDVKSGLTSLNVLMEGFGILERRRAFKACYQPISDPASTQTARHDMNDALRYFAEALSVIFGGGRLYLSAFQLILGVLDKDDMESITDLYSSTSSTAISKGYFVSLTTIANVWTILAHRYVDGRHDPGGQVC
jgi:hypothetical protein